MKFVIMFTFDPELDVRVPEERMQNLYERAYQWYGENAAQISDGGAQLQPLETATNVKYGQSGPVVADGPFSEAKEAVGGFSIIDVPDMDAAIVLVRTWPYLELPGWGVEIRPDSDRVPSVRGVSGSDADGADVLLSRVVREESGRIVAALARSLGSLDIAEEAVAEAIEEALRAWRKGGIPPNPAANEAERRILAARAAR